MNEYLNFKFSSKNIIILIFSMQIALVGIILLESIGFTIPLVRQLLGFVCLGFLPGFLILQILNIEKLNKIEVISYSAGLSLALIMILGLIHNSIYYLVGNSKPISLIPLLVIFAGLNFFLLLIYYKRNIITDIEFKFDYKNYKIMILLVILPVISIFGTYLYNSNIFTNFALLLLSIIVFLIIYLSLKVKSPEIYPLAILSISLSLLLHRSLITNYLTGWDIQLEYYYASMVVKSSFYNLQYSGTLNSLLSITLLNPIFSIILNVNEIWIFKVIYPLYFSIVPLFLYNLYNKSFNIKNEKISFFSVFLFMSFYAFFTEMLALARQEIAMLFIVLIAGLIVTQKNYKLKMLSVIFIIALVLSHYTTAYIFLFIMLIFILPILIKKDISIGLTFLGLFVVLSYSWYTYTSDSSSIEGIFRFIKHIFSAVTSEFFSSSSRDPGVGYIVGNLPEISLQRRYFAILQYIIQFFIFMGIIVTILSTEIIKIKKLSFVNNLNLYINNNFALLAFGSFFLLIVAIIVPIISTVNVSRIFIICLMFLAPLAIIGGVLIFNLVLTKFYKTFSINNSLKIVVILILLPYFLLNTGFVYYITNDPPSSISLDKNMDFAKYTDTEIYGVKWLVGNRDNRSFIYGDVYGILPFMGYIKDGSLSTLTNKIWWKKGINFYLYLRERNLNNELLISKNSNNNNYVNLTSLELPDFNKVYDNGDSNVLKIINS